ncbi:MAG: hypothetical protein DRN99_04035 [Thermoproteota archaeon]|nr:MAG: hypothetical protein DRN99_04035 [Candidatus Korarchaeota archaeon]
MTPAMEWIERRKLLAFGEDYGTSYFKFGPATLGNKPDMFENRGYFYTPTRVEQALGAPATRVIVGPDLAQYLQSTSDLSKLYYPMRHGTISKDDEKGWTIVKEITRYALNKYAPKPGDPQYPGFKGFWVAAAIAANSPNSMYERLIEIHRELNEESDRPLVQALTIIPQPLAVAISQKQIHCIVIESGHGNTQITPISRGIIYGAMIPLNRGGQDADNMARQILRDLGYQDIAREEKIVTEFKEAVGLIPLDLNRAVSEAKRDPRRFKAVFQIPEAGIRIELEKESWQRFLIGEYVFNPSHPEFESYYSRGFHRPLDTPLPWGTIPGDASLAQVIRESLNKCAIEVRRYVTSMLILSGGNFSWRAPPELSGYAVDAPTKIKYELKKENIDVPRVMMASDPQYSVWRGCIFYATFLKPEIEWDSKSREGWVLFIRE